MSHRVDHLRHFHCHRFCIVLLLSLSLAKEPVSVLTAVPQIRAATGRLRIKRRDLPVAALMTFDDISEKFDFRRFFRQGCKVNKIFCSILEVLKFFCTLNGYAGTFNRKNMNTKSATIGLALLSLLLSASTGIGQEAKLPQKVETSTGIFDVQSRDDIYRFSAREIRELVQMENGRRQSVNSFPHPVLVYCFEERSFRYTAGRFQDAEIPYRLRVPKNVHVGRKYPLVVHLHGNGDDSLTHAHAILPMLIGSEQQDFFMLVPQGPRNGDKDRPGWYFQTNKDGPLDVAVAAMEHVIANNPIDEMRITITGISGGGWGAWELILNYPDTFAGAVLASCGAPRQSTELAKLSQTPIWIFNRKGNNRGFSESIPAAMSMINDAGGSMASTEVSTTGTHAWSPAMENYNALLWMLAQKKGSLFSPPPGTIVNKPYPLLLVIIIYILPIAGIIFLVLRGVIGKLMSTSTVHQ